MKSRVVGVAEELNSRKASVVPEGEQRGYFHLALSEDTHTHTHKKKKMEEAVIN